MADNGLDAKQKAALKQFVENTQADPFVSKGYLQRYNFSVDRALDRYFDYPNEYDHLKPKVLVDKAKLARLFDTYATDPDPDAAGCIYGDLLGPFYKALNVNPNLGDSMVVAWHLGVSPTEPGIFRKHLFEEALTPLGIDTLEALRRACTEWITAAKAPDVFREFYAWLYAYINTDVNKKQHVPFEVCVANWNLVLPSIWPLADQWALYTENLLRVAARTKKPMKPINSDVWRSVCDFVWAAQTLDRFQDDGSWPSLIEGFFTNEGDWHAASAAAGAGGGAQAGRP